MKLCIILGTRPEIIKMSPIIKYCESKKLDYFIIHTGQHYSFNMDKIFFDELKLPQPKYNMEVKETTHGKQTGSMMIKIEPILMKEKPDMVLVEGDTNSVLAGALTANKLNIKVGHVEAGLRSYDLTMPEELNRKLTDHISDYLFAPTECAKKNLLKEGISEKKIFVTGNTIVDALYQNIKIAEKKVNVLERLKLKQRNYIVLTLHRQENVDKYNRIKNILDGIKKVSEHYNTPVIWPIHPRTVKVLKEFNLTMPKLVKTINPIDYLEFLQLEEKASLIMTDSGGLQEESCILKIPCVTLRDNTERPETLEVGSNTIVGVKPSSIFNGVKNMFRKKTDWKNPFGDGKSAEKIVKIIQSNLKEN